MDKKILLNYLYNILFQMVRVVLPLVTVPYLYSHVGAETLGISDFASNIAQWFVLFGILGVNIYGNREIAKVRDDRDKISTTFFEIFFMQLTNMFIAFILYFLYVYLTVKENTGIFYLTGVVMIASMLDVTWLFYGVEDFKKASIRNIVVKVLGVSLILLTVKTPDDLWLYVVINCVSELIGQLIMFAQLKQYVSFKRISIKSAYKNHFFPTLSLFVPTIAISIYTILDQTMLGYLHSPLHLNYYKTSMSFIKMFLYFITSIGSVVLPRVANVFHNDNNGSGKVEKLINETMQIALFLAIPMTFGMAGIARIFISWYLPSAPIIADLIILGCPIVILISISNVTGTQYMVPTGMTKEYSTSVISGALINMVINLILIPKYGAYGAIVGSLVAEASVTIVQMLFIKKRLSINFFNASQLKYLISAFIMSLVVTLLGNLLLDVLIISERKIGLLINMIQIISGAFTYFACLVILKDQLIMKIIQKLKRHSNVSIDHQ